MVVPHAGDSDKVEIPFYNWGKTSLICSAKKGSLTVPGRVSSFSSVLVRRISCIYYYFLFRQFLLLSLCTYRFIHSRVWTGQSTRQWKKDLKQREKTLLSTLSKFAKETTLQRKSRPSVALGRPRAQVSHRASDTSSPGHVLALPPLPLPSPAADNTIEARQGQT